MSLLARSSACAHTDVCRAFQAIKNPSGESLEPRSCVVFGGPTFFLSIVQKRLANLNYLGKLQFGSRKPSSRSGSASLSVNPYCGGQGCSEYARTVLTHGGPVNKLGHLMRLSSPWHPPIEGITGSRKPVHQEATLASLSARGGASLPRLTLPRLSYHHGRLCWEHRCGHSVPVPKPFAPGVTVLQAAKAASCSTCAHMEALVGRRRSLEGVAHV